MTEINTKITAADGVVLDATILERPSNKYWAIISHGITADKDEGGAFERLAADLLREDVNSLRFSFRGHGESECASEGMTVAGEMLDVAAVVETICKKSACLPIFVTASFGAVSCCLLSDYLSHRLDSLVLWNPVLSLQETFIKPRLPWGLKNFTGSNISRVYKDGYFFIDQTFKVGHVLWTELHQLRPCEEFLRSNIPTLIIHGDEDTYVPYDISKRVASERLEVALKTIRGGDHGFENSEHEAEARRATLLFINARKAR